MKLGMPVLALVLLGAVTVLAPLAYATPPDPTWVAGFWDDNDHDDVIFLITSDVGAVEPHLILDRNPVHVVVSALPQIAERPVCSRARSSSPTRAPPVRRGSV